MLNFKKVLAVTLASATVLTFAPVAQLGAPVVAEAAVTEFQFTSGASTTASLDEGKTRTYKITTAGLPDKDDDSWGITAEVDHPEVLTLSNGAAGENEQKTTPNTAQQGEASNAKTSISITDTLKITASAPTTTVTSARVTINYGPAGSPVRQQTFTVPINAVADIISSKITLGDNGVAAADGSYAVDQDQDSIAINSDDETNKFAFKGTKGETEAKQQYIISDIASDNTAVLDKKAVTTLSGEGNPAVATLTSNKPGKAIVTLTFQPVKSEEDKWSADDTKTPIKETIVVNVNRTKSDFTVDGKDVPTVEKGSYSTTLVKQSGETAAVNTKTLTLTDANTSASIDYKFENAIAGEQLKFTAYSALKGVDGKTESTATSDITVSNTGRVTATQAAVDEAEKAENGVATYYVLVSDGLAEGSERAVAVKVNVTKKVEFTSLTVQVDDETPVTVSGSYKDDGTLQDGEDTTTYSTSNPIALSTKNRQSIKIKVTSNTGADYLTVEKTFNPTDALEWDDATQTLTAKKATTKDSTNTITFTARPAGNYKQTAKITLNVTVSDKNGNNKLSVADADKNIVLTNSNKSVKVTPSVTYKKAGTKFTATLVNALPTKDTPNPTDATNQLMPN